MGGRWRPWGTIRIKICNHPTRDQPLTRGANVPGNPNSSLAIGQPGNHDPSPAIGQPGNHDSSLLSFYFLGWLLLWRAAGSKWRRLRSIFSICSIYLLYWTLYLIICLLYPKYLLCSTNLTKFAITCRRWLCSRT